MKNIIDIAVSNADFSTLVTAIKAAGLIETLSGTGPFTVFAPTNDAFKKIPEDTLKSLLADKAELTTVLKYHVLPGKRTAKELRSMTDVTTLEGTKLTITADDGVTINESEVVTADIEASNGLIHSIDTVLMP